MKTYKVSLIFIFDDEENPEIKNKDDAISQAIEEIDTTPLGDFYFDVEAIEEKDNKLTTH